MWESQTFFFEAKKDSFDQVVTPCVRDTTLEAVSDGLYVSPAIETADYHASLNKNSWFYVFDYQTKYGDYATVRSQAMGLNKLKRIRMFQEMFYYPNFPLSLFLLYHGEGKFYEFAFSHVF